jgi:two-component system, chemotaxis family, chemotaxis protein CheY
MDGTSILSVRAGGKLIQRADILLVQSSEEVARGWRESLLDFGITRVRTAPSGTAALEAVRMAPPSCVVIALPELSEAFALMGALTHDGSDSLRGIPILLVANQPSRATLLTATHAGFDAVLAEPVSARQIYRRVASMIQRARLSVRTQGAAE